MSDIQKGDLVMLVVDVALAYGSVEGVFVWGDGENVNDAPVERVVCIRVFTPDGDYLTPGVWVMQDKVAKFSDVTAAIDSFYRNNPMYKSTCFDNESGV